MKIEKPQCNFRNCKYHQDGNCFNASKYENCTLTDLHQYIAKLTVDFDNAKADTARKMQERINAHFDSDSDYFRSSHGYIRNVVDQIAKEIAEGKT